MGVGEGTGGDSSYLAPMTATTYALAIFFGHAAWHVGS